MKELRIHTYCDACLARGEHTEVDADQDSYTITLRPFHGSGGRGGKRNLDLCEKDEAALLGPIRSWLAGTDAPAIVPKAKGEVLACPLCDSRPTGRGNLVRHLVDVHGIPRAPAGTSCPDCGFTGASPLGIAVHRNRKHGWTELADMMKEAKRRGH